MGKTHFIGIDGIRMYSTFEILAQTKSCRLKSKSASFCLSYPLKCYDVCKKEISSILPKNAAQFLENSAQFIDVSRYFRETCQSSFSTVWEKFSDQLVPLD